MNKLIIKLIDEAGLTLSLRSTLKREPGPNWRLLCISKTTLFMMFLMVYAAISEKGCWCLSAPQNRLGGLLLEQQLDLIYNMFSNWNYFWTLIMTGIASQCYAIVLIYCQLFLCVILSVLCLIWTGANEFPLWVWIKLSYSMLKKAEQNHVWQAATNKEPKDPIWISSIATLSAVTNQWLLPWVRCLFVLKWFTGQC